MMDDNATEQSDPGTSKDQPTEPDPYHQGGRGDPHHQGEREAPDSTQEREAPDPYHQ